MKTIVLLTLLLTTVSEAACDEPCEVPLALAKQAYECALTNHPEARDFMFRAQEQNAQIMLSRQIPNPEIEAKVRKGDGNTFELDITQPIELGGKREAREARTRVEGEVALLKDRITAATISNSTIAELVTLEQVRQSKFFIEDTRQALGSLVSGFKSRPILTPEQTTTVRIFEIFARTLEYQVTLLLDEEREAKGSIAASIGRPLAAKDLVKFNFFKNWPELVVPEGEESLVTRLAHVETRLAEQEGHVAQAETWPDLKIGPSIEHDTENDNFSAGVGIGISIPLWHRNQGLTAVAQTAVQRLRAREAAVRREQEVSFQNLIERYSALTKFLRSAPSELELRKGLKETKDLFERGLVPPSSLVESYRSSFELLERIQDAQRKAFILWASARALTNPLPVELP